MKSYIVNKINRSVPETWIVSIKINAEYFLVNDNGDLVFYEHFEYGNNGWSHRPITAFAAGNWLTVDGQSLNSEMVGARAEPTKVEGWRE